MLRDYLLYAESGGTNLGIRTHPKPNLNPFERDVMEHLTGAGIPLIAQFGQSGYWIDFAAMHPDRRSEPVLAIETDGAQYHSAPATRDRDRLLQEHLERLGWRFHRIWSTDWFRRRESEITRAVEAFNAAVRDHDEPSVLTETQDPMPGFEPPPETPRPTRDDPPQIPHGLQITSYDLWELGAVIHWVKSDGLLHTETEIVSEVMQFLGFQKRGSRIVSAIGKAIRFERDG